MFPSIHCNLSIPVALRGASKAHGISVCLLEKNSCVYSMYIRMQTKIQKWGNSLGLRIPRAFATEAKVEQGSLVDVSIENGCLCVRPVRPRRYLLRELLEGVSQQNLHAEIPSGGPVGREAW